MHLISCSKSQFTKYLFFGLLIIFGSLQTGKLEPVLLAVSALVAITFMIQLWNEYFPSETQKRRLFVIYCLLFLSIIISFFPLHLSNPFSIFHYSLVRSLFLISIPTVLLWSNGDDNKQERLLFFAPLFFLVFLNSYYLVFDFNPNIQSDHARHCSNAFLVYDMITGQDGYKLLQTIFYYDFYQPLVYIISFPFLLIFGKSYTAATLSLPLFWLPIGYISTYKFFTKYVRINYAYASVFTFVIFGSVVATSLGKQLMLDFPALCMVCFYNYRLAKSGYLKDTKQSFYVGLIFGLGILTKSNFLLLAFIPLLFSIIRLFLKCIRGRFEFKDFIFHIFLHLIGMILGGGFWFLMNNAHYSYVLHDVTYLAGKNEGDPIPMSFDSFIWYPTKFLYYFSPICFLVMLVGFFYSIKYFEKRKYLIYMGYASLLLAYIIGTITWNKDVRTLLPAIFYFYPALLGILLIPSKILRYTSIAVLLIITFLINISFVNYNKLKVAEYLTTGPYVLSWGPTSPSENNQQEAHYVYNSLYNENFRTPPPSPLFVTSVNDLFTDRMFHSKYPVSFTKAKLDTSNYTVSFWRNFYYPDYYLFRTKCENGNLYIQKIGEKKHIGGDIKLFIFKGSFATREVILNNTDDEMKIPIDSNAPEISFAFREFHAWPSGQLSRLLYKIIGDVNYTGDNVPLFTYSLPDKSQVFTIQNLDLIKK